MSIFDTLLSGDSAEIVTRAVSAGRPQWGIYLNGIPIIASSTVGKIAATSQFSGLTQGLIGLGSITSVVGGVVGGPLGGFIASLGSNFSVVDFAYRKDYVIADYPIEQGSFQSYDKVEMPFDIRMRIAAGGDEQNRRNLLVAAQDAQDTMDLYDVLTPEAFYSSCNISHVDYRRTAINGVGLLVVDIWLVEIRDTAISAFTNTAIPGIAGAQAGGNVSAASLFQYDSSGRTASVFDNSGIT